MKEERKLGIAKLGESHLETRVAWMNEPLVFEMMDIDLPISLEGTKKWYQEIRNRRDRCDFCLVDPSSQEILGMCGLTDIHDRHKRAEMYLFIGPGKFGRGYGKTLTKWLCCFGFMRLNLNRIYLFTMDSNVNAYNIYEHIGFRHEGTLLAHQYQYGKYVDKRVYGMLKEEWRNQDYSYNGFFNEFQYL